MSDDLVDDLMSFTGLGREEAATLLEASNFDLAAAATLHFEQQDGRLAGGIEPAEHGDADDDDAMDLGDALDMDPEVRADHIEQAAQAARAEAEPEDGSGGEGGGYFDAYPRLRYCLALLWRTPGVSMIHSFALSLGRVLYSIGLSGLLMAPLQLLGLISTQPRPADGAPTVQRLESNFEAQFGETHPTFFRGTCQQALSRSRQQAKFVLVCLIAPAEEHAAEFSRRVLASALFSAFADENFVFWLGDVAHPEGRAVRQALRVRELPALVVLAHGDMAVLNRDGGFAAGDGAPPAQALGAVQGARVTDEEHVIAQLNALLEAFEPMLVAARAEQNERAFERQLREQQEEEYARALAEDQAREAAEAAEEERQLREARVRQEELERAQQSQIEQERAEADRREARRAKADSLPAEPPVSPEATRVAVRMPDGTRLQRRFASDCALRALFDWVESAAPDIYDGADFELVSNFPRQVLTASQGGATLDELGLHPAATLFTKECDE